MAEDQYPAGHSSQKTEPADAYFPATHSTQVLEFFAPSVPDDVPAGQSCICIEFHILIISGQTSGPKCIMKSGKEGVG